MEETEIGVIEVIGMLVAGAFFWFMAKANKDGMDAANEKEKKEKKK